MQPTIEPAVLDPEATQGITDAGMMTDFVVGTAMSIEFDGPLPDSGVTLTRTYAAPLPEDAVATFAYWDAEYGTWRAVTSTLSPDRRTVTAVVHHLSWWNDFIAGSKDAIGKVVDAAKSAGQAVSQWATDTATTAAEALHWSLGNIFTTRVELPECDFPTPNWVIDLPVGTAVDDPVRFCAGYDKANPGLLVVKARANRGYGFPVSLAVTPAWEYNSSSENSLGSMIDTVGNLDKTVATSMAELLNHGRYVAAGKEVSFGIPASALRGYSAQYLMELPAPSVAQFVSSTIAQQLVAWGVGQAEGQLAAALAMANCWSSFASADDVGKVSGAVLTCVNNADEKVARLLGEVLRQRGMQENAAGKLAGKLVGRVSLALAFIPAVISTFDYLAETNLPRNARALSITIDAASTAVPSISDQSVGTLLVPAGACVGWGPSKPVQLSGGKGETFDSSGSGTGILDTRLIGAKDLTGDGADDAVLLIDCTGTPAAHCCAGRASILPTVIALDLAGANPVLIGNPITGGSLASSEGPVPTKIGTLDGRTPVLDGKDILTYEAPIYDLDDPQEAARISGWFRHTLTGGAWTRSASSPPSS
ncbi:hypothetical protein [Microbacterium sp. SLBN-111]|uniref:hypothetical protein n=1 Tax=Microbacterium sp. SLBN-111 TaxID=3377733 RepID=UPI003C753340